MQVRQYLCSWWWFLNSELLPFLYMSYTTPAVSSAALLKLFHEVQVHPLQFQDGYADIHIVLLRMIPCMFMLLALVLAIGTYPAFLHCINCCLLIVWTHNFRLYNFRAYICQQLIFLGSTIYLRSYTIDSRNLYQLFRVQFTQVHDNRHIRC
jgi:hypothetical protein